MIMSMTKDVYNEDKIIDIVKTSSEKITEVLILIHMKIITVIPIAKETNQTSLQ